MYQYQFRRLCCCCCADVKDDTRNAPSTTVTEEDYLLPGSEWDPSISTGSAQSRQSSRPGRFKARGRSRGGSGTSSDGTSNGGYVPPVVPPTPSRTLPTFEEFKLLKTVGKGAFGKVRVATPPSSPLTVSTVMIPANEGIQHAWRPAICKARTVPAIQAFSGPGAMHAQY